MAYPMTLPPLRDLVIETIRAPGSAAARILEVDLPRRWLWMALGLMCVLNAMITSISIRISPPAPEMQMMVPPALQSPVLFALFLYGALVIMVMVLQWIGQSLGGAATRGDILVLMTWLQVMRLLFQALVLVLSLVSLAVGSIVVLAGSVWAIYIMAAFIDRANGFGNLLKAFGVMVLALIAVAFGLSLFLAVLGIANFGGAAHV